MDIYKVMRRDAKNKPWQLLHKGILVDETNSFAKIFNPAKVPGNYDTEPRHAEWFPWDSDLIKIEKW